ncbi:MAG: ABC transporter ATP-binding protein [Pseudomonadota bacterium]
MLAWFERLIDPFAPAPSGAPPASLGAFYWHYVRQVWPWMLLIMVIGVAAAWVEIALFQFLGQLVDLVREASDPATFFATHGATLLWMAFVAVILRPLVFGLHAILISLAVTPSFTNLIRWQNHRYVLRQSLGYFQNDFAGRVASRIVQTGPALRESVVQVVDALWFTGLYTLGALVLFAELDIRLIAPLLLWLAGFVFVVARFVPKVKARAAILSGARSSLTGRIVDSYTNIQTVKLFAHAEWEEAYAREALEDHTDKFRDQQRLLVVMELSIWALNGLLIAATAGLALWLWSQGLISVGAIALATGLVIRIVNMSGWIMWVLTGIFENIGMVQEGMETIARPYDVVDAPGAPVLHVDRGEIVFDRVTFHYGKGGGVIEDLSLRIGAGEKVGLVGRSGAGKSTLVSLLLRFHDLEGGRVSIDGQDIASVAQESLRAKIGMVTQDPSLLHRSILANVRYGNPDAAFAEAEAAVAKAHADGFVPDLVDADGRTGYAAHVGERGVKLSGGQRQRIAIARALLKDAPILVLDEATSALDSEVEAAIQEQLGAMFQSKTVIAIAHRLSTIAAMDRLVVMDAGRIVEEGTHESLLAAGGLYADLWHRQSGGFLAREDVAAN